MRLTMLERAFLTLLLRPGCASVGPREVARAFYGAEEPQYLNNARSARNHLVEMRLCARAGTRGNKCKLVVGADAFARRVTLPMRDGQLIAQARGTKTRAK